MCLLKLKSNVTRSIAESQGSSKEFLNEKAQTIERERERVDKFAHCSVLRVVDDLIYLGVQINLESVSLVCFNHRKCFSSLVSYIIFKHFAPPKNG